MLPVRALNNVINSGMTNAKALRHLVKSKLASVCTDKPYVVLGETTSAMVFTAWHTPFFCCILAVIFASTSEQTRGTDAQMIVAVMADNKSIRNGTMFKQIGNAVCSVGDSVYRDGSVPVLERTGHPLPAAVSFFNLLPKFSNYLGSKLDRVRARGKKFHRFIHGNIMFAFSRFGCSFIRDGAFIYNQFVKGGKYFIA